jgi:hypothetical protein
MSDTLLVATRKGLFTVSRKRKQWAISAVEFLGDNVSICLADRRDGQRYAALDHGHFGVKLHRSKATGWEEIAAPTYPLASGHSNPVAQTSQASSGVEPSRGAFSARRITERVGR